MHQNQQTCPTLVTKPFMGFIVVLETLTLKVRFVILRDVTSVDVCSKYNTKQSEVTPPPVLP